MNQSAKQLAAERYLKVSQDIEKFAIGVIALNSAAITATFSLSSRLDYVVLITSLFTLSAFLGACLRFFPIIESLVGLHKAYGLAELYEANLLSNGALAEEDPDYILERDAAHDQLAHHELSIKNATKLTNSIKSARKLANLQTVILTGSVLLFFANIIFASSQL